MRIAHTCGPTCPNSTRVMHVLFVCDNAPLSSNFKGSASLKLSHLRLLLACLPGSAFTLLVLDFWPDTTFSIDELSDAEKTAITNIIHLDVNSQKNSSAQRRFALISSGIKKMGFFYDVISNSNKESVENIIQRIHPDLIWTEHIIENSLLLLTGTKVPVIYSHHDFVWKINTLKNKFQPPNLRRLVLSRLLRHAEKQVIENNTFIVSGSLSEIKQIKKINPAVQSAYLPTTYEPLTLPSLTANFKPRIVHLGTMHATAVLGWKDF
jgi:hypothetical protein